MLLTILLTKVRGVLPIALVGLVCCGIGWFFYQNQGGKREYTSATPIPLNAIEVQNIELKPGEGDSTFKAVGRIKNNSVQYTLVEIRLQITVAEALGEHREVVGQGESTIQLNAPPGQAREFDSSIYFLHLGAQRGERIWSYQILNATGR